MKKILLCLMLIFFLSSCGQPVYLYSANNINWQGTQAAQKARQITRGLSHDKKIKAIYEYIIDNFTYDGDKAKTVQVGYLPDLEQIYQDKKGICYDYASLFAGMCRSVGIECKLITGWRGESETYHAWNEVLIKRKWVTIDTTVDATQGDREMIQTEPYRTNNEY